MALRRYNELVFKGVRGYFEERVGGVALYHAVLGMVRFLVSK